MAARTPKTPKAPRIAPGYIAETGMTYLHDSGRLVRIVSTSGRRRTANGWGYYFLQRAEYLDAQGGTFECSDSQMCKQVRHLVGGWFDLGLAHAAKNDSDVHFRCGCNAGHYSGGRLELDF